ncbi:PTS mannose/fructose/sorbose/N-acetylgalactosamine transporter subunit IIC [Lachnoclostridium sp. An138]|uniref:PTS mannose/fructose/sorbose/N-acetylgalactosamine transporter subunit IIC n=1 Tax=Lachnoclostridium sp. An138 TaxID=1965560 RepID=UPI000B399B80|nr:PTS sugar transporter subunit IIC [Lachnoclostridium sp. An138]OUQ15806.1 PTS sorbose transporter subunit IIC [Lachnoclostridium sp. An138]
METLSVWQALIIALWIGAVMSRSFLGGATTTLRFTPMMTGLVCGIVMGDVANAMIVVAAIQLIYMGVFSPGGQMPSEPAIAAAVAVPVALLGNLDAEASIAIAVPVGLLGSYLYQFRFFLNTLVLKATDKYAAEANGAKLTFCIIGMPIIIAFLLFTPLMFVALYFGSPVIASIVNAAAGTLVFHVLSVIGNGLAAIGIAVTVYVIGRKEYIVFFLLAYFLCVMLKTLSIPMITYAIIGTVIAVIFVLAQNSKTE